MVKQISISDLRRILDEFDDDMIVVCSRRKYLLDSLNITEIKKETPVWDSVFTKNKNDKKIIVTVLYIGDPD